MRPTRSPLAAGRSLPLRRRTSYVALLRVRFIATAPITRTPGGLLHRHFTLTRRGGRYRFCDTICQWSLSHCPDLSSGALPFGVRTFLIHSKMDAIARRHEQVILQFLLLRHRVKRLAAHHRRQVRSFRRRRYVRMLRIQYACRRDAAPLRADAELH